MEKPSPSQRHARRVEKLKLKQLDSLAPQRILGKACQMKRVLDSAAIELKAQEVEVARLHLQVQELEEEKAAIQRSARRRIETARSEAKILYEENLKLRERIALLNTQSFSQKRPRVYDHMLAPIPKYIKLEEEEKDE